MRYAPEDGRSRTAAVLVATAIAATLSWSCFALRGGELSAVQRRLSFVSDFVHQYRPNAEYLGARLRAGELPLWNPQQALGGPFLATLQSGVVYPPNWLHALLPRHAAFVVISALHIALAALFAAFLSRALGASLLGAALAGLLYASATRIFTNVWIPPALHTAAWLPAVLLMVDRILSRPTPGRIAALALCVGLQALAGWPYTLAMTALASGLYALVRLVARTHQTKRIPLAALSAAIAAAALGAALAAPLLLPAIELLPHTSRALGSVVASQAIFVDAPHDLGRLWGQLLRQGQATTIPSVVALLLAFLAPLCPREQRLGVLTLLGIGALFFCASYPDTFPVYDGFRALPVLGDFRFPFRYRLVSLLAITVLAGVGMGWVETRLQSLPRPRLRRPLVGAVVVVTLLPRLLSLSSSVAPLSPSIATPPAAPRELSSVQIGDLPERQGPHRLFWSNRSSRIGAPQELHVLYDLEPLSLAASARLLTFLETGRPATVDRPHLSNDQGRWRRRGRKRISLPFYGRSALPSTPQRASVLDLLSADLIATRRPASAWLADRYEPLGATGGATAVYANPHALPRAFRVHEAEAEPPGIEAAMRRLISPDFDPRRRVLLDEPPEALLLSQQPAAASPVSDIPPVLFERYEAEYVRLRSDGRRPGAVVLADAYFPGWQALVNGEPARVHRANTALRAVIVPAGPSVIEFRYRPASFRIGLILCALGLVGCSTLALAAWRPGQRGLAQLDRSGIDSRPKRD